ncbi:hypothetical protein ACHHYP_10493 [Achlya hypogyna]|uniref:Uncharacterized protein n=1 Tax=Achlya hypogyna TaxID=1202772 RepID=A0A1V9YLA8_ACHHY|nr:hypothetical protein ACHHYP_10493 [Achlya hypogyna]
MASTPTAETPYVESKQVAVEVDPAVKAALPSISRKFTITFLAIGFILCNALALYLLHFLNRDKSYSDVVSSSAFSATSANQKPVSFSASGTLRVGAGTTAYLAAATLPTGNMLYVNTAPMGTSQAAFGTNIFSYYLTTEKQSVVTTMTVNSDKTVSIATAPALNVIANYQVRGIATLSDKQAVFIEQSAAGITAVVTGSLTQSPAAVEYQPSQRAVVATASLDNKIGALSASTFVIASFEPYVAATSYSQFITGGSVAADGTITLTGPLVFGEPNFYSPNAASKFTTFGNPTAIRAVPGLFLLPWWSSVAVGNKGLCLVLGSYSAAGVTQVSETCNAEYMPSAFLEVAALSSDTVAMAFNDAKNQNTLTIAIVQVATTTQMVYFRGAYTMGAAAAGNYDFGMFNEWTPKPSLKAISATRLAVAFLNPSASGKPYTQVFQITSSYLLVPVTPLMPLAVGDFTLAGTSAASSAVTLDLVQTSAESYVVVVAGVLGNVAPKQLALVEFFGDAVGIASGSDGLVLNGVASVSGTLTVGKAYYATTAGSIVAVTVTDPKAAYFLAGDSTLVTANARLGVAVSSSSIYVAP